MVRYMLEDVILNQVSNQLDDTRCLTGAKLHWLCQQCHSMRQHQVCLLLGGCRVTCSQQQPSHLALCFPPGINQLLIRWTASVQTAASRIGHGLIPTSHGLEWGNVTVVNLAPFFQCMRPLKFFWDCVTSPKHMSCSSIMLQQPGQLASYTTAYGLEVHKLGWHNWHSPVLQDYQSDPAKMSN